MKNSSIIKLTVLAFLFPLICRAQLSLEPVDGVFGGTVSCVYTTQNGSTFIGTHGGIYTLNHDTDEWEIMSNGINFSGWQARISDITEVNGNLLAASLYLPGIYLSKDQGNTWQVVHIFNGEYESGYVKSFTKVEKEGKTILYAASQSQLMKSEDNGESWVTLKVNYSGMGAPLAISDDGDLYCGSGEAGLSMFKASLENDTVWSHVQAYFESGTYTQLQTYGEDTIFTIFSGYDESFVLLRSQSDGLQGTWHPIKMPFGADSTNIQMIKMDEEQALWAIAGSGSAYKSMDGGNTWETFAAEYPLTSKSASIDELKNSSTAVSVLSATEIKRSGLSNDIEFIIGSEAGVHIGRPEGGKINLRGLNNGLRALTIKNGIAHNGTVYGMDERGGVFVHTDQMPDASFEILPTLFPSRTVAIDPNSDVVLLGGYEGIAQLTTTEIKPIEIAGIAEPKISAMFYDPTHQALYAGYQEEGSCKIAVSADYGKNWNPFATVGEFYEPSGIAEYDGKLALSSTGSASIAFVDVEKPEEVNYEIAAFGNWSGFDVVLKYDQMLVASGWDGLSIKESPEQEFKRVYQYEPESRNYLNDFDIVSGRFIGTFSNGISEYLSETDEWDELEVSDAYNVQGEAYRALAGDLPPVFKSGNLSSKNAAIDGLNFYISFVYGGLWKVTGNAQTGVSEVQQPTMASIYPNPAKGNTSVFFQLDTKQVVRIHIYSMSGQLVRTLTNQDLAAGSYRFVWDGKGDTGIPLPIGQYLVDVQMGFQSESHKVILLQD